MWPGREFGLATTVAVDPGQYRKVELPHMNMSDGLMLFLADSRQGLQLTPTASFIPFGYT